MTKLASENGSNKANAKGFGAKDGAQGAVDPSVKAQAVPAPVKAVAPGKGVAPVLKKVLPEQADEANAVKKHHDEDQAGAVQASEGDAPQQLAMVDSASAASVGAIAADGAQDGGAAASDSSDDGDAGISTPLIIGGVLLAGGGAALALGGGGKKNAPPTLAATQTVTTNEDTAVTVTATATDPGDTLTYTTANATNGTVAAGSTAGTFVFTPNANFNGSGSFTVTATDSKGQAVTQTVTVTVNPVNDAPVISSNGGGDTAAVNVFENSTVVTTVTSTDVDANATKTFSISGGADASKFDINATTGALSFKAAPDFETKADANADGVYVVNVQVSDGTATDTQAISVTVVNVNEAPVFTSGATGTVAENAATTTVVYDANATDADAGSSVTYTLAGADAALFTIDADDGEVRLKSSANFEAKSSYAISVVATDNATPALTATKDVTISVTDVNEAPTAVALDPTTAALAENATVTGGVKVATIAVTDDALGTETLTLTGADAASFEIRNGNELFFVGTSPNFEVKPSYAVTVNADDTTIGAAGSIEAFQAFTLSVTDVNEAPTAVVLSNQVTTIAENSTVTGGVKVADIAITDDALGTETLTLTGADAASFEIRNGNELFYIGGSPNFEADSSYSVTVNADDTTIGAAGSIEASQSFTLNVTDVADALVLPTGGTVNAGVQGAGQTDTNFIFTEDGNQTSAVTVTNFSENDFINLINADEANLGFSRENATDLRIEYSDTGDTNTISVIILQGVLDNAVDPVFDEATAAAAMGFTGTNFLEVFA